MQPTSTFLVDSATKALVSAPPWGASAPHISLVMAPFTPSPTLVLADLTLATFTGSAAKVAGAAVPVFFVDPVSGDYTAILPEPAGGWLWAVTALTNLPQTIYGFVVTNTAGTVLLASELFDPPIQLQDTLAFVSIDDVRFRIHPLFIS